MRMILLAILFFITSHILSQIEVKNLSSYSSNTKTLVIGFSNIVKIISDDSISSFELMATHSKVTKVDSKNNKLYYVKPEKEGDDTLTVLSSNYQPKKNVFHTEKPKGVICYLGEIEPEQNATLEEILKYPYLKLQNFTTLNLSIKSFKIAKIENGIYQELYNPIEHTRTDTIKVIDIETGKETIQVKNTVETTFENKGNELTEYQKNEIRKLKSNSFLEITVVKVISPEGITRTIRGFYIRIK